MSEECQAHGRLPGLHTGPPHWSTLLCIQPAWLPWTQTRRLQSIRLGRVISMATEKSHDPHALKNCSTVSAKCRGDLAGGGKEGRALHVCCLRRGASQNASPETGRQTAPGGAGSVNRDPARIFYSREIMSVIQSPHYRA